eukprot:maker-scaffold1590_size34775-snap-gene-0.4 protein:Tk12509 transcript:maker-scaffold1590_size34775-snap-gene-0.4-mRNA-1 annotation:"PREDICTED: uncharacterized protein LOC103309975"
MKISLREAVLISYYWALEYPQKTVVHETGITKQTLVDWYNFHREVGHDWRSRPDWKLTSPSLVRGSFPAGCTSKAHGCVFGAIERETQRCFMTVVERRDASTLLQIIKDRILPGTTIIYYDCWKAYTGLSNE